MSKMMEFIREQPAAFGRILGQLPDVAALSAEFRECGISKVWMLGSGTSLYAAMIAAEYWEGRLGLDCEAISSLEFLDHAIPSRQAPHTCVLAISQSGASFVLVEAVSKARKLGCLTVGVTAEPDSLLAGTAKHLVQTYTGPEDALGKTKGFSTTAFAACLIGLLLDESGPGLNAVRELPQIVMHLIAAATDRTPAWVEQLSRTEALFVLGAGQLLPSAWEGGLKLLEVAKQVVITKELEEMLHGPFNAVGPKTGFILLAGSVSRPERLTALLNGIGAVGCPLVTIAESALSHPLPGRRWDFVLPTIAEPRLLPILAVVPLQILAERLASHRGLDPDAARYPFLYRILAAKSIYI